MTTKQVAKENTELGNELKKRLKGEVKFDRMTRALYATDASIFQMDPIGVVFPKDVEDVVNTVAYAASEGFPVLPRGGGTGLAGQTVNHAVVMDFSKHMNQLSEMNSEEGWAWVEPGIVLDQLSALGAPHGLKFAPDPSTTNRGNIGGAIGNNSCGARSIVYGKTLDHVLELEVVLADGSVTSFKDLTSNELEAKLALQNLEGQIYRDVRRIAEEQQAEIDLRYPKIQRRVSGYNLDEILRDPTNMAKVVVGSEGTLVTFTRAKVRMVPRPKSAALAVIHFNSIMESFEATVALLDSGASAIEMMDDTIVKQGRKHPGLSQRMDFVEGNPAAMLLVEASGDTPEEAQAGLDRITKIIDQQGLGYHTLKVTDPKLQGIIWAVRRDGLGLIMSVEGTAKPLPFVEDTAVPPERLPEYFKRFDELVRDEKTTAAYYGHASVGCLHIRPLVDIKQQDGLDRMVRIAERVSDLVLEFGGSLSGEHGDGIVRGVFTEKMFGSKLYASFREFKHVFDPKGIMNPGKIIDCPPLVENLRFDPQWKSFELETYFDFSKDGGIAEHVEMCNGQGACRQVFGGTMCPSFMATRDEENTTRGRANALRNVFSGVVPQEELTGERLHEVLEMCLACKGCKIECPSSVDMAKLKYEVLGHYHKKHGYSLRDRLFAKVYKLNPIGNRLAPVLNLAMMLPGRGIAQSLIGIHPKRTMPKFATQTFSSWFKKHQREVSRGAGDTSDMSRGAGTRGRVLLFNDTFMEGNHPEVGIAATKVLEKLGFSVETAPRWCCGRTMMSKGMMDPVKENARNNVDLFYPYAQAGIPIIGTEPSCLLTLRDEYPDLLPGDSKASTVASQAFLLDEFLAKLAKDGDLELDLQPHDGKVIFHGHCHQKAISGVDASIAALKLVPGVQVETPDTGCCGMAGAFGFEKEHYDVSMTIGERVLFPAVRNNPDATIVTTGVSCHQQVEDGTGVTTMHLAEFLAQQLGDE
jgi:FAD/FMN-containing dehydrogenase/Fe-S oxidoreductase